MLRVYGRTGKTSSESAEAALLWTARGVVSSGPAFGSRVRVHYPVTVGGPDGPRRDEGRGTGQSDGPSQTPPS